MKVTLALVSLLSVSLVQATFTIGSIENFNEDSNDNAIYYDQEQSETSSENWRLVFHVKRAVKNAVFSRFGQEFKLSVKDIGDNDETVNLGLFRDHDLSYGKAIQCFNRYFCEAPQLDKYMQLQEAPRGARKLNENVKAVGIMHNVNVWDRFTDNFRIRKPIRSLTYILWIQGIGDKKQISAIEVQWGVSKLFISELKTVLSKQILTFDDESQQGLKTPNVQEDMENMVVTSDERKNLLSHAADAAKFVTRAPINVVKTVVGVPVNAAKYILLKPGMVIANGIGAIAKGVGLVSYKVVETSGKLVLIPFTVAANGAQMVVSVGAPTLKVVYDGAQIVLVPINAAASGIKAVAKGAGSSAFTIAKIGGQLVVVPLSAAASGVKTVAQKVPKKAAAAAIVAGAVALPIVKGVKLGAGEVESIQDQVQVEETPYEALLNLMKNFKN